MEAVSADLSMRDAAVQLARSAASWAIRLGEPADLYAMLEHVIAPLFYTRPLAFAEDMQSAIALNGSYYNAHRIVTQYLCNAKASCAELTFARGGSDITAITNSASAGSPAPHPESARRFGLA